MSVRDGFIFNGKHSYKDFNVWLQEKKIQPPAKVKIKETVPVFYFNFFNFNF